MALQADAMADMVNVTLKNMGKGEFTVLATDKTKYVAMPKLLKKKKVGIEAGHSVQRRVMVAHSNSAAWNGLFAVDEVNVTDVFKTIEIPWRHVGTNCAWDLHEPSMNRGSRQIVNLIKSRRLDGMISLADVLEDAFWSAPDASTDTDVPFGIPYWIVKNATEGLNGGNPSGFSAGAGGLSSSTYAQWANRSGQYTAVTKTDLIRMMRKAATYCKYFPPVKFNEPGGNDSYGYYTNYAVLATLEEELEKQNDRLGNAVDSKDGMTLFRKSAVQFVPKLDEDTDNPVYGINWGDLQPVFLRGWWMKESKAEKAPNQHNVVQWFLDMTLNFICFNRRTQFVLSTAA